MSENRTAVDPFRCSEPSNDGDHCDLQPNHGGLMHSGVLNGSRIWWDAATGDREHFGRDDQ